MWTETFGFPHLYQINGEIRRISTEIIHYSLAACGDFIIHYSLAVCGALDRKTAFFRSFHRVQIREDTAQIDSALPRAVGAGGGGGLAVTVILGPDGSLYAVGEELVHNIRINLYFIYLTRFSSNVSINLPC